MTSLNFISGIILLLVSAVHSSSLGIVGGKVAEPGSRPYQVAFVYKERGDDNGVSCSGSIITEKYILTSALCCKGTSSDEVEVIAGVHDFNKPGDSKQVRNILSMKMHENYDFDNNENDICIVTLDKPLTLGDKVAKAKLPTKPFQTITGNVLVSGWGAISSDDNIDSPYDLRVGTFPVIDRSTCIHDYRKEEFINIDGSQFCAGNKGHDECYGDEGAPATCKGNKEELCGVVSRGYDCGDTDNHPSIFTQVNYYLDWIKCNTLF